MKAGHPIPDVPLSLLIKWKTMCDGKEECVRETQEGFPALIKTKSFQNILEFWKLAQAGETTFSPACAGHPIPDVPLFHTVRQFQWVQLRELELQRMRTWEAPRVCSCV